MNLLPVQLGVPLVYKGKYSFDQEVLIDKFEEVANTLPDFQNYARLEIGNAGSSAGTKANSPHTWIQLEDFTQWALGNAKNVFEAWKMPGNVSVQRSWFNKHGQGGQTVFHTHPKADLVMSAYIKAEPGSGNICIVDPLEYHWFGLPSERNRTMVHGDTVEIETNTVLFFAPFLRHATEPNVSGKDRWVLTFNFRLD